MKRLSACRAVFGGLDDLVCCVNHSKDFRCFSFGWNPQSSPFPCMDIDSHLKHGSLGHYESAPQKALRSVQPFLQGSTVSPQTDRQRDHATYGICRNRLHLWNACDAV